jgi:hypothetical protein
VLVYNDGNIGRVKVLEEIGLQPGVNTVRQLQRIDRNRVAKADKAVLEMSKEARTRKRNARRRLEESQENPDDPEYEAGRH